MSLTSNQKNKFYDNAAEALHYASMTVPAMHKTTAAVIPVVLEVPLFAVMRKRKADEVLPTVNATWFKKGRGFVKYAGPQLLQSHLTVLLTLINLRAGQVVDNVFEFRPSELLARMGWSDNARNISRLTDLLDDLKHGQVRLWSDGQDEKRDSLRVSFVDAFQPATAGSWTVTLSKQLMPLFDGNKTFVSLAKRSMLDEGLDTFLHGYLAANSCALPFAYKDIHAACGSRSKDLKDFTDSVQRALDKLVKVGAIADYKKERGAFRVLK